MKLAEVQDIARQALQARHWCRTELQEESPDAALRLLDGQEIFQLCEFLDQLSAVTLCKMPQFEKITDRCYKWRTPFGHYMVSTSAELAQDGQQYWSWLCPDGGFYVAEPNSVEGGIAQCCLHFLNSMQQLLDLPLTPEKSKQESDHGHELVQQAAAAGPQDGPAGEEVAPEGSEAGRVAPAAGCHSNPEVV